MAPPTGAGAGAGAAGTPVSTTVFDLLETLPRISLDRLYGLSADSSSSSSSATPAAAAATAIAASSPYPWTCRAVFQSLPPLAKQYVMRLLCLEGPVTCALLEGWVDPAAGARAREAHRRAVRQLDRLRILLNAQAGKAVRHALWGFDLVLLMVLDGVVDSTRRSIASDAALVSIVSSPPSHPPPRPKAGRLRAQPALPDAPTGRPVQPPRGALVRPEPAPPEGRPGPQDARAAGELHVRQVERRAALLGGLGRHGRLRRAGGGGGGRRRGWAAGGCLVCGCVGVWVWSGSSIHPSFLLPACWH